MDLLSADIASSRFMELLNIACQRIDQRWFVLPVDSRLAARSTAYRERVYCYELYHQLRRFSDAPEGIAAGAPDYLLSGEIDKAGLNVITVNGREKPDLVWHVPGTSRNAVVIEVKPASRWSPRGVAKDLKTLAAFLNVPKRGYRRGVLLIFGPADPADLQDRVRRAADAASLDPALLTRASLLWHAAATKEPQNLGSIT
jgi:hypothetical protein